MSNEKLTTYMNELLAYNKHFLTVVRSQKTDSKVQNTKAIELMHHIDMAITTQIAAMEKFDDLIGESNMDAIKNTAAKVAGKVAGGIDSMRKDPVSKMLRDDYAALSMQASGYTMLYTVATALDRDDLAEFSKSSLEKTAQLITETSQTLPYVVASEFMEDESDALKVAEKALEETQEAWKPENMFEEA